MVFLGIACATQYRSTTPTVLVYIDAYGEKQHINSHHEAAADEQLRPATQQKLVQSTPTAEESVDAPILDALKEHEEMESASERLLRLKQGIKQQKDMVWHDKKVDLHLKYCQVVCACCAHLCVLA
jgi:hypothetical protein